MTVLTLGESLLRLSTSKFQRLRNATQLEMVFGGAESNVAMNLSQLNHLVSYATALPQNELTQNLLSQFKMLGVQTANIKLIDEGRIGSYFVETGSGVRASSVIYDRAYSVIALLEQLPWDMNQLFNGVELFHMSGITLGLSKKWQQFGYELIKEAKQRNIPVSFDMNYRQKLWTHSEAKATFAHILPLVDFLSAGKLDAKYFMDIDVDKLTQPQQYLSAIAQKYPQLKAIYGTVREMINPNSYRLKGYYFDKELQETNFSKEYTVTEVVDRIGAGDAYSAGILHGILKNESAQAIVEFAMAASVLKHTVFGDVNQFTEQQINEFIGNTNNIIR